jgi:oxygen-dependent protoporphyrinogen oxidase
MEGGPMASLAAAAGVPLVQPPGAFLAVAMHGRIVRADSALAMLWRLPISLAARLSMARVGLKMLRAQRAGKDRLESMTFAELLGPLHPDVESLMRVVANRLTGEPRDLSAYVGVSGFNHLWLGSRLNIAGGSAALPRALQLALGDRVETGARVVDVRQGPDRVELAYSRNGERHRLSADACIVAVPAPLARGLVADLPSPLDEALTQMRYTPFVVAGLFTNETGAMPWDDFYAVAVPDRSFCMLFNPANAVRHGPRRPGGSLVVYAVADRAAQLMDLSDAEIAKRYLDDLRAIFPQTDGIIRKVVIQRWPHGTALGYPNRSIYQARLARGWERVAFAGDYMMPIDGVDASESGRAAADTIRAHLIQGSSHRTSLLARR